MRGALRLNSLRRREAALGIEQAAMFGAGGGGSGSDSEEAKDAMRAAVCCLA